MNTSSAMWKAIEESNRRAERYHVLGMVASKFGGEVVNRMYGKLKEKKITWVTPMGGIYSLGDSTEEEKGYSFGVETPQGYPQFRLRREMEAALEGVEGVRISKIEPHKVYAGLWRVCFMFKNEVLENHRKAA